jgi:choline dehydrogenase-like flavoprotein
VCVRPAIDVHGATLIDQCVVERVEANANEARYLVCRREGKELLLKARVIVLAAGALMSPIILLRSRNDHWPAGLGNSADLVGRNLMFHASDFHLVWPRGRLDASGPRKTLAFRDFYAYGEHKLGMVQSSGIAPDVGSIIGYLKNALDHSRVKWPSLLQRLLRIPAYAALAVLGEPTTFATILEDLPYRDNRVVIDAADPNGMHIEYTIHQELRDRLDVFRDLCARVFVGHRHFIVKGDASLNYSHACGTCRFGTSAASSVLDVNNKVHGLSNLYVVDASFFPTSGGANPSLTIAANALRVAEHINEILREDGLIEEDLGAQRF